MGDPAQMTLKRVDDARRYRLGACARQLRGHGDGGEVNLRQRRDRQMEECEKAGQSQSKSKKRRSHRPGNEELGEAHSSISPKGSGDAAFHCENRAPSRSKYR